MVVISTSRGDLGDQGAAPVRGQSAVERNRRTSINAIGAGEIAPE
jgi:hypothetical protein